MGTVRTHSSSCTDVFTKDVGRHPQRCSRKETKVASISSHKLMSNPDLQKESKRLILASGLTGTPEPSTQNPFQSPFQHAELSPFHATVVRHSYGTLSTSPALCICPANNHVALSLSAQILMSIHKHTDLCCKTQDLLMQFGCQCCENAQPMMLYG